MNSSKKVSSCQIVTFVTMMHRGKEDLDEFRGEKEEIHCIIKGIIRA